MLAGRAEWEVVPTKSAVDADNANRHPDVKLANAARDGRRGTRKKEERKQQPGKGRLLRWVCG